MCIITITMRSRPARRPPVPAALLSASLVGGRKGNRLALLERIGALGSITAAARAVGLSYKSAWEAVEAMNNLSEEPLVRRTVGGRSGGGTELTPHGRRVLDSLRQLEARQGSFLAALGQGTAEFEKSARLFWRLGMRTSARNQFLGTVKRLKQGSVEAEVTLDIGGGDEIVAVVTATSARSLGLAAGQEAYALFKAPWVILVAGGDEVRTSARNRLVGTVSRVRKGTVDAEVVLDLPGGKQVVAVVTRESAESMGIRKGSRLSALIKASHVIVAVP